MRSLAELNEYTGMIQQRLFDDDAVADISGFSDR